MSIQHCEILVMLVLLGRYCTFHDITYYFKMTRDRVKVINPLSVFTIHAYSDANFSGMYGHEKIIDQACMKSRTRLAITFVTCLILQQLKLQTETTLLMMEAELMLCCIAVVNCSLLWIWLSCCEDFQIITKGYFFCAHLHLWRQCWSTCFGLNHYTHSQTRSIKNSPSVAIPPPLETD